MNFLSRRSRLVLDGLGQKSQSLDRSWQVFGMFSAVSTMVAMILAMVLTWIIVNIVSTVDDIVANVIDIYILNKILVSVKIEINFQSLHTLIVLLDRHVRRLVGNVFSKKFWSQSKFISTVKASIPLQFYLIMLEGG